MESKAILIELKELSSQNTIKRSELLSILKKYARTITVYDLMRTSERMRKEGEYLNEDYRDTFLEIYIKNFLLRIKEVTTLKDYEDLDIDKDSFDETSLYLRECLKKKKYLVLKGTNSHYFM